MKRTGIRVVAPLALALCLGLLAGRAFVWTAGAASRDSSHAVVGVFVPMQEWTTRDQLHPVHINLPDGPPRIATGEVDGLGRPVTISCASCHSNLEPNMVRRSSVEPPMMFHQGQTFAHGTLSCVSCHNPHNYNTLRLADGSALAYSDVMQMCAQCHAPQARDYDRGAHGGMTGFWDRTRGAQVRKSCIDCHDPHAPKFPTMTPTFKPIDRFLPIKPHDPHHPPRAPGNGARP